MANTFDLEGFRWRNDDGTETTATWKEVQDIYTTAPAASGARLRVIVEVQTNPPPDQFRLQVRPVSGAGDPNPIDWYKVPIGYPIDPTEYNLNTPTTDTWECPAGCFFVLVECWGSGGGGGYNSGPGGGGGGYARSLLPVTPGQLYDYIVADFTPAQQNGQSSTFTSNDGTVTAFGGRRPAELSIGPGGIGRGGTGDVVFTGGNGGPSQGGGGGGGGGAGSLEDGGDTSSSTGGIGGDDLGGDGGIGNSESGYNYGGGAGAVWGGAQGKIRITAYYEDDIYVKLSDYIGSGGTELTTAQLIPPSASDWVIGNIMDDTNPTLKLNLNVTDYTEFEWSLGTSPSATGAYDFRVVIDDPYDVFNKYSTVPRLVIVGIKEDSASDGLTFSDLATHIGTFPVSATDGFELEDVATGVVSIPTSASDGLTFSDLATHIGTLEPSATDGITLSEQVSTLGTFIPSATDGITLSEQASGEFTLSISATDGITLSEQASGEFTLSTSASDGLTLSEEASGIVTLELSASDGLTLSEQVSTLGTFIPSASDGITLSDQASALGTLEPSASDGLVLSDLTTSLATLEPSASDGITLSEETLVIAGTSVSASDGIEFTDEATHIGTFPVSASDGLELADTAIETIIIPASASDGLELADTAIETITIPASASDGITFSDTTTRVLDGLDLEGFRFRNDDGDETDATWMEDQDTHIVAPSGNFRIRTIIKAGTVDVPYYQWILEARQIDRDDDYWVVSRPNAEPLTDIHMSVSTEFVENTFTTAQLDPPSGAAGDEFIEGRIQYFRNPSRAVDLNTTSYTEVEWCVACTSAASGSYDLRVTKIPEPWDPPFIELDEYSTVPRVIIQAPTLVDGITFTDEATHIGTFPVSASDGIELSDLATHIGTFPVSTGDGLELADLTTHIGTFPVSASDGIEFTDEATRGLFILASASDGFEFTDAATTEYAVSASDGIELSDVATHIGTFLTSASDGIELSDVAAHIGTFPVSASDGITFSDTSSGNLIYTYTVSGADGITFSDVASSQTISGSHLELEGHRFRNDDGSETNATWREEQDNYTAVPPVSGCRLRLIVNSTIRDNPPHQYKLQVRQVGDVNYSDVPVGYEEEWVFTATGTDTWTCPPSVHFVTVECWGGAGGGAKEQSSGRAGGGGGAGYARSLLPVTPGEDYAYTVGAGGIGGTYVTIATNGAHTEFTADGGEYVRGSRGGAGQYPTGQGGYGGSGIGDVVFFGGVGGNGNLTWPGGGGGGAGSLESGTQGHSALGGIGGDEDGGDGGVCGAHCDGYHYGGGGAGSRWEAGAQVGGDGYKGKIKITGYYTDEIYIKTSSYIPSAGDTTYQLTPPDGKSGPSDFVAGRIQDDENPADSIDLGTTDYTELEWSLGTSVEASGAYDFRVVIDDPLWTFDDYLTVPRIYIGRLDRLTDGITLSDAASGAFTLSTSASDGLELADLTTSVGVFAPSATDGIELSDLTSRVIIISPSASDGLELADLTTETIIIPASASDGLELEDWTTGGSTKLVSASDGFELEELTARGFSILASASDGLELEETISPEVTFVANITDGFKLADTSTIVLSIIVSASDGFELEETLQTVATFEPSASDGFELSDVSSAVNTMIQTVADGLVFSDTATEQIIISISVSDSIEFTDAGTTIGTFGISVLDGFTLSDLATEDFILHLKGQFAGDKLILYFISGADWISFTGDINTSVEIQKSNKDALRFVGKKTILISEGDFYIK